MAKKSLNIMVDEDLLKKFTIKCVKKDLSKQKLINEWIIDFMNREK